MKKDGGKEAPPGGRGVNRRKFLKGMGTGLAGSAALGEGLLGSRALAETPEADQRSEDIEKATVSLKVNGKRYDAEVEPRQTLLFVLREKLQLTGTKQVCSRGECGACTVMLNGRTVYACMMLAIDAHGAEIRTIEGLASGDKLHPVQEKFIEHDALQCGFCTPGFEIALADLLERKPNADLDEIKKGLSGNICRCGTYPHIFNVAVELTGGKGGN